MAKVNDKPEFFSVKVFLTTKADSIACRQWLKVRSNNHHPIHSRRYTRQVKAANNSLAMVKRGQCYV
ncbi:hypothetical protein [Thalassomonas sp. RHCl1]|uniref:hypothetical protein n=1 Tax=Thalassomonas sp. RHCl1 TaxID=2995320 RepID=UPI00248C254C|nr:hypothetical protein [Thalassomonas sp. RHCl1]